jgi:large subunit ribosomal protein L25
MDTITIEAEPRETGKKATKAVRNKNNVPCILYGPETDPVAFQVSINTLNRLIYQRTTPILDIEVDGEHWNCIMKEYDLHPITDRPIHADFQVLNEGRAITLTVPIRYEGTPVGQKEGGDTQYNFREVSVRCLPEDIPSEITVNVEELDVGDAIHFYDLEVEGVEFQVRPEQTLVTVVAPRLEVLPEEEEEEELLEGELEEGELPEGEEGEVPEGEEGEPPEGEDGEGA